MVCHYFGLLSFYYYGYLYYSLYSVGIISIKFSFIFYYFIYFIIYFTFSYYFVYLDVYFYVVRDKVLPLLPGFIYVFYYSLSIQFFYYDYFYLLFYYFIISLCSSLSLFVDTLSLLIVIFGFCIVLYFNLLLLTQFLVLLCFTFVSISIFVLDNYLLICCINCMYVRRCLCLKVIDNTFFKWGIKVNSWLYILFLYIDYVINSLFYLG